MARENTSARQPAPYCCRFQQFKLWSLPVKKSLLKNQNSVPDIGDHHPSAEGIFLRGLRSLHQLLPIEDTDQLSAMCGCVYNCNVVSRTFSLSL